MPTKKAIGKKTVENAAILSRLILTQREVALYSEQLESILTYISKLNEVDTKKTPPTSHPLEGLKNVFRKDKVRKSLPIGEALKNAPSKKDNFFSVPRIME